MTEPNIRPWFGLDDYVSHSFENDPKPLYNEKNTGDQEKALNNPEQSIDKDPDKPWVQKNERAHSIQDDSGVNPLTDKDNKDPEIDNWAEPERRDDVPPAR